MISLLLLKQIAQLFLSIFLGWLLVKCKLLKSADSRVLSVLTLYAVTPCVIIDAFQIDYSPELLHGLLLSLGAALLIHLLYFALANLCKRPLHLNAIELASSIYSNAGNLILPIVSALFGKEWLIYTSPFIIIQLPLFWSHCRLLVSGEKSFSLWNVLRNVNIISIFIGFSLFILRIPLPSILLGTMDSLGGMIGPLSMMIAGMLIGGMDLKQVFAFHGVWKAAALRLLVFPLAALCLLKFSGMASLVPDGGTILLISFLAASAPAAATVTQLVQVYDKDAEYASAIYTVTTLLCIVTMPLMIWLYQL